MKKQLLSAAALFALATSAHAAIATFDNLNLAADSYYFPAAAGTFTSDGIDFVHNYTDFDFIDGNGDACCWNGFTYSNTTDTTTPGSTNQYSAITGGGVNGSANYGVSNPSSTSRVNFNASTVVEGAYFTNTTWAFIAMRDGDDGNETPFVSGPFDENDFFTLTVNGLDSTDNIISTMDISLASGTDILDSWLWTDMSSLGLVNALEFSLTSSDITSNRFGTFSNTPAYFAIDDLTTVSAVPVPAAAWLFLSGLIGLAGVSRKRA